MMLQTKCKYFNKKTTKIMLFFLILMWSLVGQYVYGIASTHDGGIVKAAAALTAVGTGSVANSNGDGYDDANVMGNMKQQTFTKVTTTTTAIATSASISISMNNDAKNKTLTTTENKGIKYNNATIYGHINENDNNSNKLPQNVARKDQQQLNKMHMNMKMPPPPPSQPPSLSTAAVTETAMKTATPLIPPTVPLLMAKDQLNKTVYDEIPKSMEQGTNENQKDDKREQKTNSVKLQMSMAREKVNDTIIVDDKVNVDDINNKTAKDLHKNRNLKISTDNERDELEKSFIDNQDEHAPHSDTKSHLKKSYSTAFLRHQLISRFAIDLKKIPRVTYFTCKTLENINISRNKTKRNIYKRHAAIDRGTLELIEQMQVSTSKYSNLMLKIVYIDHLVQKNNLPANNAMPRMRFNKADPSDSQSTRHTFTNVNWLEQILRPELYRQIIVLNLDCGASSLRLLEMASNKAFFNSKYHWLLLLGDYVLNRQTEIDEVNDIENKMSSSDAGTEAKTVSGSKSWQEEIVNDSKAIMQVKKLSIYSSDVVGASTSGTPGKLNKVTSTSSSTISPTCSNTSTIGKRQQQLLIDEKSTISLNCTRTKVTDEDDIEIIEKFLEKLNININTELILAKRQRVRGSTTLPTHSVTVSTNMMRPTAKAQASPASMEESDDYEKFQKMDYYLLYDVWNPGLQYGGELNVTEIGHFNLLQGLQLFEWYRTTSTTKRRMNMNLANVRCLVVITHKNRSDSLEEYLTTHYDTHLDSMNRFNFALLSHVRDLFNFSFILSKTSTWGYLKNGKFDGMIGALVRKQADIGGSPIFFRIERAKVIDYTTRTWVARPCFIFRHPHSTKKDRIVFLQPFTNDVWMWLAICGFITIVLLWIVTSWEHKFNLEILDQSTATDNEKLSNALAKKSNRINNLSNRSCKNCFILWYGLFCGQAISESNQRCRIGLFFESLLFYVGAVCQQGLSFSTRFFSARCIVITSLLFSFSIYQFYSASIVGTLLMEKPKTIRTLKDLIHSSLEIGIEDIVYNRDYFLRTKDPDALELYAKKVTSLPKSGATGFVDAPPDNFALPTQLTKLTDAQKAKAFRDNLHSHESGAHAKTNEASNWYDPEFGVAKIKKGRFAFHVDVATAYKIIADTFTEKEICDLTEIQLFPPQKMVGIVQKGSPLRKAITYGLRRVTEVGLTDYQRKVWHSPKPRCVKQLHTDDLRVDMQTFTSALLVLIVGYAVSLLILSLEIVHFKLWQRYTIRTT